MPSSSARLDRYFDAMRSAIQHHGGSVEKFIGDAVVGAFGVIEAHEDDALRAVRAALEMRGAAAELDTEIGDPEIRILMRIAIDCDETARRGCGGATQSHREASGQGKPGGDRPPQRPGCPRSLNVNSPRRSQGLLLADAAQ